MMRFLGPWLIAAACLAFGAPAFADTLTDSVVLTACGNMGYTNGSIRPDTQDLTGKKCVNASATISGNVTVVQPTASALNATVVGTGTFADQATLQAGSAIVGKVGIDQTTPGSTNGVNIAPTSASTAAIAPVISSAAESNHVLKGSAGNLYSVYVTTGATAGFLMVFNATSAPGDGAVTPIHCVGVGINSSVGINFNGPPESYATGITAVFSSTGCFTKTASATAFFHGSVQ